MGIACRPLGFGIAGPGVVSQVTAFGDAASAAELGAMVADAYVKTPAIEEPPAAPQAPAVFSSDIAARVAKMRSEGTEQPQLLLAGRVEGASEKISPPKATLQAIGLSFGVKGDSNTVRDENEFEMKAADFVSLFQTVDGPSRKLIDHGEQMQLLHDWDPYMAYHREDYDRVCAKGGYEYDPYHIIRLAIRSREEVRAKTGDEWQMLRDISRKTSDERLAAVIEIEKYAEGQWQRVAPYAEFLGKAVSLLAEKDRPGRVQTLERWLGLERPPRGLILMALSDALPYVGRKEQVHIMEIFQRFLDCPSVSIRACAVHSIGRGIVHLARADRRSYLQNLERAREDVDARVRSLAEKNIEDLKARGILKR